MLKRETIDDYTDDPYTWENYTLYGSVNDISSNGNIEEFQKYFGVATSKQKFLHGDLFSNDEVFMFCVLLKLEPDPKSIYGIFLNKLTFFDLISDENAFIGRDYV